MRRIEAFVFDLLHEKAIKIVPPNELKFLPTLSDFESSWIALTELIFVIERFLISRVPILRYTIIESAYYNESGLNDKVISNLKKLKKMLRNGDTNINNRSLNFLPPSSKSYFRGNYGTSQTNYRVDFINQFFGIKHFHISSDQDVLLYYAIYKNCIYFLKIGKHADLYEQDIVQNLIKEFPKLLEHLGIVAMPDMPVSSHKYTPKDVERIWLFGGNISYVINDKYYTSCNPQTLSLLNSLSIKMTQDTLYQIRSYLAGFTSHLKTLYPNLNQDFEIEPIIYDYEENVIEIGSLVTKDACEIKIDYLRKLKLADTYLAANLYH